MAVPASPSCASLVRMHLVSPWYYRPTKIGTRSILLGEFARKFANRPNTSRATASQSESRRWAAGNPEPTELGRLGPRTRARPVNSALSLRLHFPGRGVDEAGSTAKMSLQPGQQRGDPAMTFSGLPAALARAIQHLGGSLDPRLRHRFLALMAGMLLCTARRRTVSAWVRQAGLSTDYRLAYPLLASAARSADDIAAALLADALALAKSDTRLTFSLDDTPTKRHGPKVQGAGTHRNPTRGAHGSAYLYGHVWVTLCLVLTHPHRGTVTLPLLARLYIRRKDIPNLPPDHARPFRTKLQLAAELITFLRDRLPSGEQRPIWLVADGAYATRCVLKAAKAARIVVVSRLRKDAALCSVPKRQPKGKRGRPRVYGETKVDLGLRAANKRGWRQEEMTLYGAKVKKKHKWFEATWRVAGGKVRVVLVDEATGWRAYFSTDTGASASEILGAVAARSGIEQVFADVKGVCGVGQQQVRDVERNEGAYLMGLWGYSLVEVWAWGQAGADLVDRSDSPWDDASRRPSHADKRKALLRLDIRHQFHTALGDRLTDPNLQQLLHSTLLLVA